MQKFMGVKIVSAEPCLCSGTFHKSKPGDEGYVVTYEDGYTSWLPKKAFEDAYRPMDGLTFGLAIEALKKGFKLQREGWNGKGMFLELQTPTDLSKMTLPYIYMSTVTGDLVPWLASQTDMLAEDWQIVE